MSAKNRPEQDKHGAPFRRWLRWTGKYLGITIGAGAALTLLPLPAQDVTYRASESAPIAWREFALKVQARLHERLSAGDEVTQVVHRRLEEQANSAGDAQFLVLKVWVTPSGRVERLDADELDSETATSLRGILVQQEVGATPPSDLLQPLHLKLSLGRPN